MHVKRWRRCSDTDDEGRRPGNLLGASPREVSQILDIGQGRNPQVAEIVRYVTRRVWNRPLCTSGLRSSLSDIMRVTG